ncbi:MAG: hypothetical protein DCF18_06520 [Cyanobium sp.]|nr:MAG: hypothetical protein DCF18_06520 [Cyanobium sp.]
MGAHHQGLALRRETLLESLRRFPGDAGMIQRLGQELEASGDWPLMVEALQPQLQHVKAGTPLEAQITYLLAKASLELGDERRSLALIGRSLLGRPDFAFSHHIKGRALARLQRCAEAIAAQQRCVELAPTFCWGWFELGCQLRHQGDLEQAMGSLRRALALQPAENQHHHRLIERALGEVEAELAQRERQEAALSLWPDRALVPQGQRLPSLDEIELQLEQFRLFLHRHEARRSR